VPGVSRRALQGASWRHVFRDVWVHADMADSREVRLAAVRLVMNPDTFICGPTAAWLYGIDVQDPRADQVWVGCTNGRRPRTRAGCAVRELTVEDADLGEFGGVSVTTPIRTVFDCARWLPVPEGVVVLDALAHAGLVTTECVASYLAAHPGVRAVRRAREVVDLADPLSESPMETRVRVLLVRAGLPRPECQIEFFDDRGRAWARGDLGYRELRLLVEYDGALHWEQRRADDRRRDALRRLGWTVLVFSATDYYRHPQLIVEAVRDRLGQAAAA